MRRPRDESAPPNAIISPSVRPAVQGVDRKSEVERNGGKEKVEVARPSSLPVLHRYRVLYSSRATTSRESRESYL